MRIVITGSQPLDRILTALLVFSVPLALSLFGGRTLLDGAYIIYIGTASEEWPKIPATITAANIVDGLGLRDKKCRVNVEYEFTVGGIHFRGNTLQYGQPLWNRSQAEVIADKYPIGTVVDALYCPRNPDLSPLESGFCDTVPVSTLIGGVFFIVGTFGLRLCCKEWRNQALNASGRSR
jgi:hypothetical protein